jgi:hypothetical protein
MPRQLSKPLPLSQPTITSETKFATPPRTALLPQACRRSMTTTAGIVLTLIYLLPRAAVRGLLLNGHLAGQRRRA